MHLYLIRQLKGIYLVYFIDHQSLIVNNYTHLEFGLFFQDLVSVTHILDQLFQRKKIRVYRLPYNFNSFRLSLFTDSFAKHAVIRCSEEIINRLACAFPILSFAVYFIKLAFSAQTIAVGTKQKTKANFQLVYQQMDCLPPFTVPSKLYPKQKGVVTEEHSLYFCHFYVNDCLNMVALMPIFQKYAVIRIMGCFTVN